MKTFLLATVSILALSSVARASDLPAKARTVVPDSIPLWAGGYMGVQGGVARHDAIIDTNCFLGCGTIDRNKTGATIGGLLGYNFQRGSFVYGLDGDWSRVGARIDNRFGEFEVLPTSNDVRWVATVRGRAGLAVDATLVYFTGGVAFGNVKNSLAAGIDNTVFFSFSESKTRIGWTAGFGVEHMFSPHWTARAEFRYVDLRKTGVACTPGVPTGCGGDNFNYRGDFSNTLMMGLVGLAYKF